MKRFKNPRDYALWLLSCREYTSQKLTNKCLEKFPSEVDQIVQLINFLVDKGYVSDTRFAENFIRSQVRRGQGRQKIFMKLLEKGVPKEIANQKLDEALSQKDLVAPLIKLLNKKIVQIKRKYPEASEYELQQKLTAYAASRGYDYGTIREALEEVLGSR